MDCRKCGGVWGGVGGENASPIKGNVDVNVGERWPGKYLPRLPSEPQYSSTTTYTCHPWEYYRKVLTRSCPSILRCVPCRAARCARRVRAYTRSVLAAYLQHTRSVALPYHEYAYQSLVTPDEVIRIWYSRLPLLKAQSRLIGDPA